MTDPFGRAARTLTYGEELIFGKTQVAHHAARKINNLHKHVHGQLPMQVGSFAEGTLYNARDPELLLWVQATLVDTLLLSYKLFVGPLTQVEEEQYYQESKEVAHLLGLLPQQMPEKVDDLKHYVHTMVHSDQLAPTSQAHELAMQTLYPPAHKALRPLMHVHKQLTNALLPQPVREIYGFSWNKRQQRIFDLSTGSMRQIVPRMPHRLRELPMTRRLMRVDVRGHNREFNAKQPHQN
jgi:uncharacterized protein (DUF2236 family)